MKDLEKKMKLPTQQEKSCKNYFVSSQKGRIFNSDKTTRALKENTDTSDYIKLLFSATGQNYSKESEKTNKYQTVEKMFTTVNTEY